MKKAFFLNLLIASLMIFTLVSCSKERLPEPVTENPEMVSTNKFGGFGIQNAGFVMGIINSTKSNLAIYLVNDTRTYGPYYTDPIGQFSMRSIEPGKYKLLIVDSSTSSFDLQPLFSMAIEVSATGVTHIGVIYI